MGVAYYIMNIQNNQRNQELMLETRQAQLLMQIYDRNCDPDHNEMQMQVMSWKWKDYDDFHTKYRGEINLSEYKKFMALFSWYEGMGVLIKNGLIKPELVDDLLSYGIIAFWDKFRPIVHETRRNIPQAGEGVEILYNAVRQIAISQHPELKEGSNFIWQTNNKPP